MIEVKTGVTGVTGVSPLKWGLVFKGYVLEDGGTLRDYDINNNSTLDVIIESR